MKICFWGYVAEALRGKTGGGGELQIALLARTLARLGHEVVVIDLDIREEFTTDEGIVVYPVKGYNDGIKMLRTFTHRLPGLYSGLRDLNADIYYCRIREYRHIIAFMAARKVNAKFILGLASDLDILDFRSRWKHFYSSNIKDLWGVFNGICSEIVYPFMLRKSDYVFVQHTGQKKILERKNIRYVVFPNLIDTSEIPAEKNPLKRDFVYVGSLDKRKGFAEFFDVVMKSPSHTFKVVGQPRDKTGKVYFEKLKLCGNVTLIGQLSHSETIKQIANSKALISTSPMEGFPNIFIEAWACGVPVLSLYVDPGCVIEKEGLGEVTHGNMDKLLLAMANVKNDYDFAQKAKAYVVHNHELNVDKVKEIGTLFNNIYISEKSK